MTGYPFKETADPDSMLTDPGEFEELETCGVPALSCTVSQIVDMGKEKTRGQVCMNSPPKKRRRLCEEMTDRV